MKNVRTNVKKITMELKIIWGQFGKVIDINMPQDSYWLSREISILLVCKKYERRSMFGKVLMGDNLDR